MTGNDIVKILEGELARFAKPEPEWVKTEKQLRNQLADQVLDYWAMMEQAEEAWLAAWGCEWNRQVQLREAWCFFRETNRKVAEIEDQNEAKRIEDRYERRRREAEIELERPAAYSSQCFFSPTVGNVGRNEYGCSLRINCGDHYVTLNFRSFEIATAFCRQLVEAVRATVN